MVYLQNLAHKCGARVYRDGPRTYRVEFPDGARLVSQSFFEVERVLRDEYSAILELRKLGRGF